MWPILLHSAAFHNSDYGTYQTLLDKDTTLENHHCGLYTIPLSRKHTVYNDDGMMLAYLQVGALSLGM